MPTYKLIFTCRDEFSGISKNEIKNAVKNQINSTKLSDTNDKDPCESSSNSNRITFERWIDKGIGIVSSNYTFKEFSKNFTESNPIFTRHINPIDTSIDLVLTPEDYTKINLEINDKIIPRMNPQKSFSVQTRILNNASVKSEDYSSFRINNLISGTIVENVKIPLDVKNPSQIISVVISENVMYMGLSDADDNLSNWAGGERRFAKEKNQISRSEFKLLEAIEIFNINMDGKRSAVDLGASPGGWTRILRKYYDMRVISVDPADIDKSLINDKKVKHIRKTSQKFAMTNSQKYDLIVNDMKIDTHLSVDVMIDLEKNLNSGGICIMTLKLPKNNIIKAIEHSIDKLSQKYNIVGRRHLFHNRHEITLVINKISG